MSKYKEYLTETNTGKDLVKIVFGVIKKPMKILIKKSKDKNAKVGETYKIVDTDADEGKNSMLITDKGIKLHFWKIEYDIVFG